MCLFTVWVLLWSQVGLLVVWFATQHIRLKLIYALQSQSICMQLIIFFTLATHTHLQPGAISDHMMWAPPLFPCSLLSMKQSVIHHLVQPCDQPSCSFICSLPLSMPCIMVLWNLATIMLLFSHTDTPVHVRLCGFIFVLHKRLLNLHAVYLILYKCECYQPRHCQGPPNPLTITSR